MRGSESEGLPGSKARPATSVRLKSLVNSKSTSSWFQLYCELLKSGNVNVGVGLPQCPSRGKASPRLTVPQGLLHFGPVFFQASCPISGSFKLFTDVPILIGVSHAQPPGPFGVGVHGIEAELVIDVKDDAGEFPSV